MAITGSGTEQDPWIVHSYDEIQTASQLTNGSSKTYVKLANDIDCNNYGASFQWATITLGATNSHVVDFDLDNHTIKNIMVAYGDLFTMLNVNSNKSEIKNGKLLNIFTDSSYSVISGAQEAEIRNASISVHNAGSNVYSFDGCIFRNCAICFESPNKLLYPPFRRYTATEIFVNCDIKLNINDVNQKLIIDTSSGIFNSSCSNCRFTGKIKGSGWYEHLLAYGPAINSVFDIDLTEVSSNSVIRQGSSGVVNSDKLPSGMGTAGLTAVTSAEIINGDALRAKGFTVVNVVGD